MLGRPKSGRPVGNAADRESPLRASRERERQSLVPRRSRVQLRTGAEHYSRNDLTALASARGTAIFMPAGVPQGHLQLRGESGEKLKTQNSKLSPCLRVSVVKKTRMP